MTKYVISKEEWWPVLELEEPTEYNVKYEPTAEVSDELKARYDAAFKEFNDVQDELWKIRHKVLEEETQKVLEEETK